MKLFRSNISISRQVSKNIPPLVENIPVLSPWIGEKSKKMVLPIEPDCLGLLQVQRKQILGLYTSMIFEVNPPFAKIKPEELGTILHSALLKEGFKDTSKVYALSTKDNMGWKNPINFLNNLRYTVEHIPVNPMAKRCWCTLKLSGTLKVQLLKD